MPPRVATPKPDTSTGPERRLASALRALGVAEWETEPRDIGNAPPDFYWRHSGGGVAVYVDGCAWHGCRAHPRVHTTGSDPEHRLTPRGLALQAHVDRVTRTALRARGVIVVPIWEHDIRTVRAATEKAREVVAILKEPWRHNG